MRKLFFILPMVCAMGCGTQRFVRESAETAGIAYTALLTTMVVHEGGHFQDNVMQEMNPSHPHAAMQFYRPWEIPAKSWNGVTWDTTPKYARHGNSFVVRTWRYRSPKEAEEESERFRRKDIHASLAGIIMTDRWYTAFNQGLQRGEIHGRFAHAMALFLGVDPLVQTFNDYRNLSTPQKKEGDIHAYLADMHAEHRATFRNAIALDLLGKAPDLWWHARGMAGYDDPAPRAWHVGNAEIRPGIVITEWRFGWGVNITLRF